MVTVTVKDGQEIEVKSEKKTLHNVFILDASGSMNQRDFGNGLSKYDAGLKGINDEIDELRNNTDVNIKISVYEFDSASHGTERITEHCFQRDATKGGSIKGRGASGNTPLYQTIAYVIDKFLKNASNDEQVLIKIFTDGAHNCNWGKYGDVAEAKKLIKNVEDNRNFTFTFIGTQQDTTQVINNLGIYASNTLSYDGTANSFACAMEEARGATVSYAANLKQGRAVKSKFFRAEEKTESVEDLKKKKD